MRIRSRLEAVFEASGIFFEWIESIVFQDIFYAILVNVSNKVRCLYKITFFLLFYLFIAQQQAFLRNLDDNWPIEHSKLWPLPG